MCVGAAVCMLWPCCSRQAGRRCDSGTMREQTPCAQRFRCGHTDAWLCLRSALSAEVVLPEWCCRFSATCVCIVCLLASGCVQA